MVYFRLKAYGVDYESKERSNLILSDPWSEYPMIKSYILSENSLLQNKPSDNNCVVEVEAGLS
jgi:NADH:ubiquinone oxidoreductase subunit C